MSEETPKRWKRGDIGPDGRVFWGYQPTRKEYWVNSDAFNQLKARIAICRNNKDRKERERIKKLEYNSRPEVKAKRSEYAKNKYADPVFRRKIKEYQDTPEVRAKRKTYTYNSNSKPGSKERRKRKYQEWKRGLSDESRLLFLRLKREKKRGIDAQEGKEKSARNYMTALAAAQQLSEELKNRTTNDNENTK